MRAACWLVVLLVLPATASAAEPDAELGADAGVPEAAQDPVDAGLPAAAQDDVDAGVLDYEALHAAEAFDPLIVAEALERPVVIGPFRIGNPGNYIEPGVGMQLRVNVSGTNTSPPTGAVELRRMRWHLRGALLDKRLTFHFQLNTTPASLEILDYWLEWRFPVPLRLRIGQFKTPFTRNRQQSIQVLALTEWPIFITYFGAERQLGLLLHDGGSKDDHWVYHLGIFTGVNARANFARGLSDVYAEPLTNRSSLRTSSPPTEIHPELFVRVGRNSAGLKDHASSDPDGGPLRYGVALSAAWDLRPEYPVDFVARLSPEVLLKWNHVFLDVGAALGWFQDGSGNVGLSSVGENVEAGWRFFPRWEVAARFSRIDNTSAVRTDARARADALIAAGATPADQEALRSRYANAGNPQWTQEVATCLTAYLVGNSLKLQAEFTWLRTVGAATTDELRFRTQLQFAF